jgi:hypothetical protein
MNNSVGMEVLESIDNLQGITFHFEFVQSFASLQQLVHAVVRTQLQQNINILRIFKEVHELSDISVLHGPMNFDFTHQLLLGSTSLQA